MKLVRELGDTQAQGRTIGNLGNTHYLLGNYKKAIKYHSEVRITTVHDIACIADMLGHVYDAGWLFFHVQRLSLAEMLGDKVASRRAYSNLGNAQVFLGKYSSATQYYL